MNAYETALCMKTFETWACDYVFKRGCSADFHYDGDQIITTLRRRSDNARVGGIAIVIDDIAGVEQMKEVFIYEFNKIVSSYFRGAYNHVHYSSYYNHHDSCCVLLQKGWWVPEIKNVHFNNPVTVVIWADGTKTIVRAQNDEPFDPEKGLAMAITKKALGNKGTYYDTIKKWVEKYESPLNIDEYCDYNDIRQNVSLNDIYEEALNTLSKYGLHFTLLNKKDE